MPNHNHWGLATSLGGVLYIIVNILQHKRTGVHYYGARHKKAK
jgi:hypothetical protein